VCILLIRQINEVDSVAGVSPLMAAVMGRQKHCVHEMLVRGAQVDMADLRGKTAYHLAVQYLPEVLDVSNRSITWPLSSIWIDLTTNIAMCSIVSNSIVMKLLL